MIDSTWADPTLMIAASAFAIGVSAVAWSMRVAGTSQRRSMKWLARLAALEAQLEKSDAVLSAHPGLILVWDEDQSAADGGWGDPKVFGGPAALASLMSFSAMEDEDETPVGRLLETLGALPVEEDADGDKATLRQKVRDLRSHGLAFAGAVITDEGRPIEAVGRVAGGQVTLWLTDPAARSALDTGVFGKLYERTADLHGALGYLERSTLPTWRRSADGTLVWANKAYVEAVEAASLAIVIKDQIELDAAAREIAQTAIDEKRAVEGRLIVNVQGERRVLKVTETPMHASANGGLGGCAVDISELDRTQTDLKRHIESNRRTLDEIPTAIALFNADQELAYYNQSFLSLWRFDDAALVAAPTHGEVLDRLWNAQRLPETDDYAAWRKSQLKLYTEEISGPDAERAGAEPDEMWHLPDGRTLRVAKSRHPLGGVLMVFEDVTEKLSLERKFNTQIRVQDATLNTLAEGIAVFGSNGFLRLHNHALKKLWRFDGATLDGAPHIDDLLQTIRPRCDTAEPSFDEVRRRAVSMSPDDRRPIENGVITLTDGRTLSFGADPLPDGATLLRFLDVTDTREREKELKERNALLEDIDRQKSKFVDHISYQLRTPLATIIGFAEMLDGQMFGVLNERQEDYIASILSASHHLRDLITDIIDLAAVDAGKIELEPGNVDIKELLQSAATYAALKAEDTQVDLKVDCAKDVGVLYADERRLKQVLFNLLSNAFAYTNAGGEVSIGAARAPGLMRIWVRDSGRGVSAHDQPQAFDAFVSRGPGAGAGVGLALVKRFVDLHGGWVRMESGLETGTCVTCFLPVSVNALKQPDEPGDDQLQALAATGLAEKTSVRETIDAAE
ncbi:MAG: ATP-binding protein [Pseudomonadota bacterium]